MFCLAGEEGAVLQEPQGPAREDPGRKVSTADIQLVQNLIERCLQVCGSGSALALVQESFLECLLVCWCSSAGQQYTGLGQPAPMGEPVQLQRIQRAMPVSAVPLD